ncbi:unnamed protein product [Polarella glacialis]|uniref:non-specific serine/threonine protein kinase n=1 Tax=Polarella glacialis TaxID=89957 RepID=A0A813FQP9_POLGL|nr:unnamed protein product [Polarella glacialis]
MSQEGLVQRPPSRAAVTLASINREPIRFLGRGAFGEVFLVSSAQVGPPTIAEGTAEEGEDDIEECTEGLESFGNLFALKQVTVRQASPAALENALLEARLLKRLGEQHDCILRCFDFAVVSGNLPTLELLLEFAPFGDLSRRLHACRQEENEIPPGPGLPELEVAAYSCDVASGLGFLHALRPKVFHRDVKPGNIVLFPPVDSEGRRQDVPQAKLADFGIAKVIESDATLACTTTVVGTPHYMPPELFSGGTYDERADSWALGCVMYEMLCLHRPFHRAEANLAVLSLRISEGDYDKDALGARAERYSEKLMAVLSGLLAIERAQRLRAKDAVTLLQSVKADLPREGMAEVSPACWDALPTTPEVFDSTEVLSADPSTETETWGGARACSPWEGARLWNPEAQSSMDDAAFLADALGLGGQSPYLRTVSGEGEFGQDLTLTFGQDLTLDAFGQDVTLDTAFPETMRLGGLELYEQ